MLTRIRQFFSPPHFEDELENFKAIALNRTLLVLLAIACATLIYSISIADFTIVPVIVLIMVLFVLLGLLYHGHLTIPTLILPLIMWSFITFVTWEDGLQDVGGHGYAVVLVMAGLLLSERAPIWFALLSSLTGAAMVYSEQLGLIQPENQTGWVQWVYFSILLFITAFLLQSVIGYLTENLLRLRQSEQTLRQSNTALRQIKETLEDQVENRTRGLETIAALGEQFNALLDVDKIMTELVNQIKQKFDYFYVHVYLLDDQQQNLVLVAAYGEVGKQLIGQQHQIPLNSSKSLVARAARTHQVIQVDDVYTIEDWLPNKLLPNTRSEIAVPILYEDIIIGVLDAQENEVAGLDEGDANLLRSLASQIGVAVKNAQLLAERQTTIHKLQKVDETKSQFITMMSHELRTPLNVINGFAEMMSLGMSGDLPDQAQADIELIHKNGLHLADLVNDILDISQIEAGEIQLEPTELVFDDIVSEVIVEAMPLKQNKPIELMTDIPADLPLIYADRTRVRQILFNLLNNAIKFTPQGSIKVVARPHTNHSLRVAFRDTGIGISVKERVRVFDSFQQVDMSDARQYGGTGLGLAICRQLVELHGGEIGLVSEVGVGSEFWFTLPTVEPLDSNDDHKI